MNANESEKIRLIESYGYKVALFSDGVNATVFDPLDKDEGLFISGNKTQILNEAIDFLNLPINEIFLDDLN